MTQQITTTEYAIIDSDKYIEFVRQTTSPASSDSSKLIERLNELECQGVDISRLLTFALGASAELGEAVEIIKKAVLQGKSFNEAANVHLLKECSDCFWYFAQLCIALDTSFEEIMQINYEKLSARYPEGTFSVYRSEYRKDGDI
jgi:NTP pyrophosphatase (non-canonical NTP hydrolase)